MGPSARLRKSLPETVDTRIIQILSFIETAIYYLSTYLLLCLPREGLRSFIAIMANK